MRVRHAAAPMTPASSARRHVARSRKSQQAPRGQEHERREHLVAPAIRCPGRKLLLDGERERRSQPDWPRHRGTSEQVGGKDAQHGKRQRRKADGDVLVVSELEEEPDDLEEHRLADRRAVEAWQLAREFQVVDRVAADVRRIDLGPDPRRGCEQRLRRLDDSRERDQPGRMIEWAVPLDEDDEPQPRGVPDDERHGQAPRPASPGCGSERDRHRGEMIPGVAGGTTVQSALNASVGGTCAARIAGIAIAHTATAESVSVAVASVIGSSGPISNSRPPSARLTTTASARPIATPTASSRPASAKDQLHDLSWARRRARAARQSPAAIPTRAA